jgi:hypothetical protein
MSAPIPTFAGVAIFGIIESMTTKDNPRDKQLNAYNGQDGQECLDGGFRGRVTFARGELTGSNFSGLAAAQGVFRSFNDGNAYILTDDKGVTWSSPVRLDEFSPEGAYRTAPDGSCIEGYTAVFIHLT